MKYLFNEDYSRIIYKAIGLNADQIVSYFKSEYYTYKDSNPDFLQLLEESIIYFENSINSKIESLKIKVYKSFISREPKDENWIVEFKKFDFDNSLFKIQEFFNDAIQNNDSRDISKTTYMELSEGFSKFSDLVKNDTDRNETKNKNTTQKTQIVILNELGLFENENFKNATLEKQGEFLANLLNMNFDNAKDYIGNRYNKLEKSSKNPYNPQSIKRAKEILSLIGFDLK